MSLLEKYVFRPGCCTTTLIDAETTRNTLRVDGPCIYCKKPQSVTVPAASLIAFGQEGGPVQMHFPNLTADEREFLLSGTCGQCWDEMFPDLEEEEDDADAS